MRGGAACAAALAILVAGASACGPDGPAPAARLRGDRGGDDPYLEITGLGRDTVRALSAARLTPEQWTALLKVSTEADAPAIAGSYAVVGGVVRFTPAYPFDRGRDYQVRLDRARLPGASAGAPLVFTFERPAPNLAPSTVVTAVYPTAKVAPENLLRMYIQFSAPMSARNGVRNLELLDDRGQAVAAPFLPLDIGFWNPDHTRFTVFFDPGRVKQGVEENERLGRALRAGRSYTLVVKTDWLDGNGLKLRQPFRQGFDVGAPETRALDPKAWAVSAPPAAGRTPVVVSFSRPLDHGLLLSALTVQGRDGPIEGEAKVPPGEIEWRFTPREPWAAGDYTVAVAPSLEDAAGNQLGRPFEVDTNGGRRGPEPQPASLPFKVTDR